MNPFVKNVYKCPDCNKWSTTKLYTDQWHDRYCDNCKLYWHLKDGCGEVDLVEKDGKVIYQEKITP